MSQTDDNKSLVNALLRLDVCDPRQPTMPQPQVGIFWLLPDRRVLIDSTPLKNAEKYGRFLIHSPSHVDTWERWRREGKVSAYMEYDQAPRGRAAWDWVAERGSLLADRRILKDPAVMKEIMERLGLGPNTRIDVDPHYRTVQDDDEDEGED